MWCTFFVKIGKKSRFRHTRWRHLDAAYLIAQGSSAKKQAPDESLFPWLIYESTNNTFLTPSQELMRKMVQNHILDFKLMKLKVLSTKRVPEFPDIEWNNVITRKSVNLDAIFTGMYSTATDT